MINKRDFLKRKRNLERDNLIEQLNKNLRNKLSIMEVNNFDSGDSEFASFDIVSELIDAITRRDLSQTQILRLERALMKRKTNRKKQLRTDTRNMRQIPRRRVGPLRRTKRNHFDENDLEW